MVNSNIPELLGLEYVPLKEDGSFGAINTPFIFEDGDPIPVYVEEFDGAIRFFDDGGVIWHFMGRGVPLDQEGDADFIRELIQPTGARLNDRGEVEALGPVEQAPNTFARYLSALLTIVRWEYEQVVIDEARRQKALAAEAGGAVELNA